MDIREKLAEYAHDAWSGWMHYLFGKSLRNADGSITIPSEYVSNLLILMDQRYDEMPEASKDSDRKEAGKMLAIVTRGRN